MSTAHAGAPSLNDSTGTRSLASMYKAGNLAAWCFTAAVFLWSGPAYPQDTPAEIPGSFSGLRGTTDTADEAAADAQTQFAADELSEISVAPPAPVADDDPYAPLGIRLGAFRLFPAIEAFIGHASNVFDSSSNPQSGGYYRLAPEIEFQSDWVRHELRGSASVDHQAFFDFSGETTTAVDAELEGRFDITSRDVAGLRLSYAIIPESRGDPNVPQSVVEPPDSDEAVAEGTYAHRFGRVEVALRGAYQNFTYENALLSDGTIEDNSDRDYHELDGSIRTSVAIDDGSRAVFVEAGVNKRDYRREIDFDGIRRGSQGYDLLVGVSFDRGEPLSGELAIGYLRQTPVDDSLQDIDSIAFRGSIVWAPTRLTTFTLEGAIEPEETTLDPTASGALVYSADIGVEHRLRENLIASAGYAYSRSDYVGSNRVETDMLYTAGLDYLVSRWLSFQLDATYETYDTNIAGENYDDLSVEAGVRLQY